MKQVGHLLSFHVYLLCHGPQIAKIVHFLQLFLMSPRKLSLLKQFIYVHLKACIVLFQKIVYYAMIYCSGEISI